MSSNDNSKKKTVMKSWLVLVTFSISVVFLGVSYFGAVKAKNTKSEAKNTVKIKKDGKKVEKIQKSDADWKKQLTDEQFKVTRKKGTERAFTGKYWNNHENGVYKCVCCGSPLFNSDTKFGLWYWLAQFLSTGE